jgi:hypothetical protein
MDAETIKEVIAEQGLSYKERARTIYTTCPVCGKDDKFSILKSNGACICYRGSCEFGKAFFDKWLSLTANISMAEAKRRLYSKEGKIVNLDEMITIGHGQSATEIIKPVPYPTSDMIDIDSPIDQAGMKYLESRGVPLNIAKSYKIMYSPLYRRVYIPVIKDGVVYGYQGRHIDKVEDKYRMRNNTGFRRELLVMFIDNLRKSKHAILAEGPFDAMKFYKVGGFVATMGKDVSDKQISLILSYGIESLYLALDEDAADSVNAILDKVSIPVYIVSVPETCKARCKLIGKKADFGECTPEECEQAFENAVLRQKGEYILYVK